MNNIVDLQLDKHINIKINENKQLTCPRIIARQNVHNIFVIVHPFREFNISTTNCKLNTIFNINNAKVNTELSKSFHYLSFVCH